jgi:predicted choloylglycine hydrolase
MNEHGLCITTSAGVIQPNYQEEGFVFPYIVRSVLNQCKNVNEAVKLIDRMKIADFRNFIIADRNGHSVLIEAAASKKEIKLAGANQDEKYLFSTNHYNIPGMKALGYPVMKHSLVRYDAIKDLMEASSNNIDKKELKKILSTTMPEGVCCHHYADGMGTLWSMIFDPMEKSVDICFGLPKENTWRTFSLANPAGIRTYSSILPNEPAPSNFWEACSQ